MPVKKLKPETLARSHGYAQVVEATGNRIVYSSGQLGVGVDGRLTGPDYRSQTKQAMLNGYAALAAAGGTPADVARLMMYVVTPARDDLENVYSGLGEAMSEAGGRTSAMTLICVSGLSDPAALVEIDVTAVLD